MKIVRSSGPIESVLLPFENYTKWTTGVVGNPNYDMYADYKTRRITLGIDADYQKFTLHSSSQV